MRCVKKSQQAKTGEKTELICGFFPLAVIIAAEDLPSGGKSIILIQKETVMKNFAYGVFCVFILGLAACGGGGSSGSGSGNSPDTIVAVPDPVAVPMGVGFESGNTDSVNRGGIAEARANEARDETVQLDEFDTHRRYVGQFRKSGNAVALPIVFVYRGDRADAQIAEFADATNPDNAIVSNVVTLRHPAHIAESDLPINFLDLSDAVEFDEEIDSRFITRDSDGGFSNFAFVSLVDFAALGFWASDIDDLVSDTAPTGQVGFFHFGLNTPTSGGTDGRLPTTGTADYAGSAVGYYYSGSGNDRYLIDIPPTTATVTFTANFGTDSFTGKINADDAIGFSLGEDGSALVASALEIDLTGPLPDDQNTFTGTNTNVVVRRATGVLNAISSGATATYEGAFYGHEGEELAGSLGITGEAGTTNSDARLILGFFGDSNP